METWVENGIAMILLEIFNDIWKTGNTPKSWKEATVIPIPKPDKDHIDPTNYHLNRLKKYWATKNGFKFSVKPCVCTFVS